MLRKTWFWVVAVGLSGLATWFAIWGFPLAFPLVNLDLRMDRAAALHAAQDLAVRHEWGPPGFRQAAQFDLDYTVQAFVELEAGGNEAFARLLEEDLYHPYTWRIRHFKPQETNETLVRFTPAGEPYGFREKLPESQEGAALSSEAAREIAEQGAGTWPVELAEFVLVESSREVRPSERVDHAFVYERPDRSLGEGKYRLRLAVSGDRFTELTHFVEVPEAFERRYGEMRSLNNAIAGGASVAIVVLLGIGGCGVGLFLLLRKRWVTWKQALAWGLVVGALESATYLGFWPLLWMQYDTAVSATNFTVQHLALALVQFLAIAAMTTLFFMAAESLTRLAFPERIQIWKLWSAPAVSSPSVLGRTVAGYLLVAAFAAYEVALYFVARKSLGWWNPSGALSDPNVLASYFPWLSAVGLSLRAGVTEECLFRAVPLASAALLGRRFGRPRLWIVGALLLQAVLFGAAHANYPAQPAYARLVELILPAVGWGVLYLAFGLLPCIVCHFAVDVVFIGLPIFASAAPTAWIHQSIIVLLTLVPIWVVLAARIRRGRWSAIDENVLNRAWAPPALPLRSEEPTVAVTTGLGRHTRVALIAGGCVGLAAWALIGPFENDAPPLQVGRAGATVAARQALEGRGIRLGPEWRELSTTEGSVALVDRFVWQQGGAEAYRELLGNHLWVPRWHVRYARFEGDVAERAEEYGVWTDGEGRVSRIRHRLPEARAGASLTEEQARTLAYETVQSVHDLDVEGLEEVSARPKKQPGRRDWTFVFKDPTVDPGGASEAWIRVKIAGDEVIDTYLLVHVPEDWRRNEKDRESGSQNVGIATNVALVLLFAVGGALGIVRWSRGRFSARAFFAFLALLAGLNVVGFLNSWPAVTAGFSTEAAFGLQAGMLLAGGLLGLLVMAAVTALNIGLAHRWLPSQPSDTKASALAAGVALGALLTGVVVVGSTLGPHTAPTWANTLAAAARFPTLAAVMSPIGTWITRTALLLVVMAALHAGTAGWSRRRMAFAVLALLTGLVLTGRDGVESPLIWLCTGLAAGAALLVTYVFVLRFHVALLPLASAVTVAQDALGEGLKRGYPAALPGAVLGAIVVLALGYAWLRWLTAETATAGGSEARALPDGSL